MRADPSCCSCSTSVIQHRPAFLMMTLCAAPLPIQYSHQRWQEPLGPVQRKDDGKFPGVALLRGH
jgi:hypothetical protein